MIADLVAVTPHPLAEHPSSSAVARSSVAKPPPFSPVRPHLLPVFAHLLPFLCDSLAVSAPSLPLLRHLLRSWRSSFAVLADLVRIAPTASS